MQKHHRGLVFLVAWATLAGIFLVPAGFLLGRQWPSVGAPLVVVGILLSLGTGALGWAYVMRRAEGEPQ